MIFAAEILKCSSAKLVGNLEPGDGCWVGLTSVFLLTMSGIVLKM